MVSRIEQGLLWVFVAGLALALGACSSAPAGSSSACGAEGGTQACVCAGGLPGGQVCEASGAWSACDCGGDDVADAGDSVTDSGAADAASDASTEDGGSEDAGSDDAGTEDAGSDDAGSGADTGDAASGDGGGSADAADSGSEDAAADAEADAGPGPAVPCTAPWCSDADPETTPPEAICTPSRRIVEWVDHAPSEGRFERAEPVPGEPVVQDVVGEVMWAGCPLGLRGPDCEEGTIQSRRMPNSIALGCEELVWGGYDDWVLPPQDVLRSIYDASEGNPRDAFVFWSGEVQPAQTSPGYLFGASFIFNGVAEAERYFRLDTTAYNVVYSGSNVFASAFCARATGRRALTDTVERCVMPPAETDNEPVIEDLSTGLTWQGCGIGRSGPECGIVGDAVEITDPQEAIDACEGLVWGGHDDWRLPSEMEASTLTGMPIYTDGQRIMTSGLSGYHGFEQRVEWRQGAFGPNTGYLYLDNAIGQRLVYCVRGQDRWSVNRWPEEPTEYCRMRGTPTGAWEGSLEDRFTRTQPVPGEPVVADAHLGAEWMGCLSGQTGSSCTGGSARSYFNTATLRAHCDSLQWGGHEDWRAPSLDEVYTLLGPDADRAFDSVVRNPTPAIERLGTRWYGLQQNNSAISMEFDGSASYAWPGNRSDLGALCIREGVADARLEECLTTTVGVFSEPVVSSDLSGLDWTACRLGYSGRYCELRSDTVEIQVGRDDAVADCEALEYGGYDNWRLPTHTELRELLDMSSAQPSPTDNRAFGPGLRENTSNLWTASEVDREGEPILYANGAPAFTARESSYRGQRICVRERE